MTTGLFDDILKEYCESLKLPIEIDFVKNPVYKDTNYIYSVYCAKDLLNDDIILLHGDLVFSDNVLTKILINQKSCMVVSSTSSLPEKDFKAVIKNGKIDKVGIEFFENAIATQPLYKLKKEDWKVWLDKIVNFCENDNKKCYAKMH